ncbi:MAG: O-antigen ligase family protein [Bacteroidaceae bacterium]|nr:O-antigen ligase family protein [Bacteroidaceae bacterium]
MVAAVHIAYMVLQFLGIVKSESIYFPLTGANENPTSTALFLVGCVPLIVSRMKRSENNKVYLFLLLSLLMSVIALRCRTAYIGLAVETVIYMVLSVKSRISDIHLHKKILGIIAILMLCSAFGAKVYDMKKDSADGRLLIWKLSAEMVIDRPLGYGYGLFAKNYNQKQAEYFSCGCGSEVEKRNANFVPTSYNDFLEHGVDGGIIGLLFILTFYVVMIRSSIKKRMGEETIVFIAFAVMSLTNFVNASIQVWYCLMLYSAFVATSQEPYNTPVYFRKIVMVLLAFISVILLCFLSRMSYAQFLLRQIREKCSVEAVSDRHFAEIENCVGTSEAYWTQRAKNCMALQDYENASAYLQNAMLYTSSMSVIYQQYHCYKALDNKKKSADCLMRIHRTVPSLLWPIYLLMRDCEEEHDMVCAKRYAHEILSTDIKINNDKAEIIKQEARNLLEK